MIKGHWVAAAILTSRGLRRESFQKLWRRSLALCIPHLSLIFVSFGIHGRWEERQNGPWKFSCFGFLKFWGFSGFMESWTVVVFFFIEWWEREKEALAVFSLWTFWTGEDIFLKREEFQGNNLYFGWTSCLPPSNKNNVSCWNCASIAERDIRLWWRTWRMWKKSAKSEEFYVFQR